MIDAYFIHLLILICIYVILAISLQLSLGFTGLLNLAHVAFFAIGAYATALLALSGYPFWLCILFAGVLAALFGYVLSIPTNKLKGDYLALATLGFSFVIYAIVLNWISLTNGPMGLPGIPRPTFLGINFSNNNNFFMLSIFVTVIIYFVIYSITKSPLGKVMEAIRDDELAARSLGKNTKKIKSISMATSAFFAGIAGSLFAYYITFIDPTSFSFSNLIPILSIVIIGGLASLPGTVFATIIIILLPEPLRFIGFPSSVIGPARQLIYAMLLLIILYYKPKGFYGKVNLE